MNVFTALPYATPGREPGFPISPVPGQGITRLFRSQLLQVGQTWSATCRISSSDASRGILNATRARRLGLRSLRPLAVVPDGKRGKCGSRLFLLVGLAGFHLVPGRLLPSRCRITGWGIQAGCRHRSASGLSAIAAGRATPAFPSAPPESATICCRCRLRRACSRAPIASAPGEPSGRDGLVRPVREASPYRSNSDIRIKL